MSVFLFNSPEIPVSSQVCNPVLVPHCSNSDVYQNHLENLSKPQRPRPYATSTRLNLLYFFRVSGWLCSMPKIENSCLINKGICRWFPSFVETAKPLTRGRRDLHLGDLEKEEKFPTHLRIRLPRNLCLTWAAKLRKENPHTSKSKFENVVTVRLCVFMGNSTGAR